MVETRYEVRTKREQSESLIGHQSIMEEAKYIEANFIMFLYAMYQQHYKVQ
jgi:hypothetical protein